MQYRWKKCNSTAHKPKHDFPAILLKEAYLHTQKNALFYVTQSSNQPQIAENTPKHVFDKLEREKRISCRETWQRLF